MFSLNFNLINDIWGALLDFINDNIVEPLIEAVTFYIGFMLRPLYLVFLGFCKLMDLFQVIIRKLAGMDIIYINGEPHKGDIALSLINQDVLWNSFLSMLALALVLLFMTTFVAILRSQFQSGQKASIMYVIGNAIRSIISFSLVPIGCLLGIYIGNTLLSALDQATSAFNSTMVSGQVFVCAAYDANQGRDYGSSFYEKYLKPDCGTSKNNHGVFIDSNGKNVAGAAIDQAFVTNLTLKVSKDDVDVSLLHKLLLGTPFAGPASMLGPYSNFMVKNENELEFSIYNVSLVYMYYNMGKFNYLIGIGAGCMVIYVYMALVMGLIKRMYMIVTLFIVSPPLVALYPLDEGRSLNGWKQQFLSNVLSAYATVVALNIYLSLMGVLQTVELFSADAATASISASEVTYVSADDNSTLFDNQLTKTLATLGTGFANSVVQLILILGGAMYFREFTGKLSALIGADDAFASGHGGLQKMGKAVVGAATTAFAGAKIAGAALKAKSAAMGNYMKARQNRSQQLRDVAAANAAGGGGGESSGGGSEGAQVTVEGGGGEATSQTEGRAKAVADNQEASAKARTATVANQIKQEEQQAKADDEAVAKEIVQQQKQDQVARTSMKQNIVNSGKGFLKQAGLFAATGGMSSIMQIGPAANAVKNMASSMGQKVASASKSAASGALRMVKLKGAADYISKTPAERRGVTAEQYAQIEKDYRDATKKAFEVNPIKNPLLYRMKISSEKKMDDMLTRNLDGQGQDQVREYFGRREAILARTNDLKNDLSIARKTGNAELINNAQVNLNEYLTAVKLGLARNDAYWLAEAEFHKHQLESANRLKQLELQLRNTSDKTAVADISRQIREVKNAINQMERPKVK